MTPRVSSHVFPRDRSISRFLGQFISYVSKGLHGLRSPPAGVSSGVKLTAAPCSYDIQQHTFLVKPLQFEVGIILRPGPSLTPQKGDRHINQRNDWPTDPCCGFFTVPMIDRCLRLKLKSASVMPGRCQICTYMMSEMMGLRRPTWRF